ncbi:AMP-binding protein [Nocardioides sp. NPDC006273]|uniref:AMP-binding protein n=1 Tax=Nocardioides sp. NPDC006273 TaxID=3155598 RepID=UPI0033A831F3
MSSYVWHPTDEHMETTNVARLMRNLGVTTVDDLRRVSTSDVGAFWSHVIADLRIPFSTPWDQPLDLSAGVPHADWFPGARVNAAQACVGRWADQTPAATALVHEDEQGNVRRFTFAELEEQVARIRSGLRARGIGRGDAVAIYLPMIPEAVVATYAIAGLGAIAVPLFSGFAASAVAARVQDSGAKVIVTADGTIRRGKQLALLPNVREAVGTCPTIEHVVVVDNLSTSGTSKTALRPELGEVAWDDVVGSGDDDIIEDTAASDTLLLGYTSGTSGKPKGAVHTHAGFLVKVASEVAYGFDIVPGRTFTWITDMGWIMGPLSIFGTHANGGTLLLYEGSHDRPDTQRLWQLVERHDVSMLGISPSLIRALRSSPEGAPHTEVSSVRIIGSTGEPWDPAAYDWLARDIFRGRVPVINFSGGTEVGGSFLSPYPAEEIASCSLGGPALGMDVDVVDEEGRPVRGTIGELVCRQPWPSMTRGLWKDPERYIATYWSTIPGLWVHGDHAMVDDTGNWFILGRSDDVINVGGKRIAPGEIESFVSDDEAVADIAIVGVPGPSGGEQVWAFWTARNPAQLTGSDAEEAVAQRLRTAVADNVGKPFAPKQLIRVDALPRTRSGKLMRRAMRAAALDSDPGDLSGAENPGLVEDIRRRLHPSNAADGTQDGAAADTLIPVERSPES